jgi:hypothetical protein
MTQIQGKDYLVGRMHNLMTEESLNQYLDGCLEKSKNLLLSYYARKQIKADPKSVTPGRIMEMSDLVVWFNLFSVDWAVLKDNDNFQDRYRDLWKTFIDRLSQTP